MRPGEFLNADGNRDLQDQNTFDNSEFCQFIDSAFLEFNKKRTENLILDLRDNMGGDNSFSISSRFSMKTSQMTKSFWKDLDVPEHQDIKEQIMSLKNGSYFDADITHTDPHAESKRFKGKVYVLINRSSYSNAAMVAGIIQDYKFGEIIGEETSDEVSSYVAMHVFKLPNTRSSVSYPKGFAVRPNGDTIPRGVVPNHIVYNDLNTDKDEILGKVIAEISGKSFNDYMTEEIFGPLGMIQTTIDTSSKTKNKLAKRYDIKGNLIPFSFADTPGAGNVS